MYLGDNLLKQGVQGFVDTFEKKALDCLVAVCPVKDPTRFGIAELGSGGEIVRLVEKPKEPKSNLALIGVYVFGPSIFDAVRKIKPSGRGELEITDAIQMLVSDGKKVDVEKVNGWWKDTGKPEDLLEANQLVLSDLRESVTEDLGQEAEATGQISVGRGFRVLGKVKIRGPVVVGNNTLIGPDAYIGPYTSIGNDCTLKNIEIENSIVMNGTRIEGGRSNKRIVDSLIGDNCTILDGDSAVPKGYKLIIGERSYAQI